MNRGRELEANLPSQASSPAPDKCLEGEQHSEVIKEREQNGGEQATDSNGVSKGDSLFPQKGEQRGEQRPVSGESSERQQVSGEFSIEDDAADEHSSEEGEHPGEHDKKGNEARGEHSLHAAQWLKSILPEVSNGWWDVRDKGTGMAIKFRWRDPDLQVITPLSVTSEQLEALRQNSCEEAKSRIRQQIALRLYNISLDPAKREKALIVARKLGINLDEN